MTSERKDLDETLLLDECLCGGAMVPVEGLRSKDQTHDEMPLYRVQYLKCTRCRDGGEIGLESLSELECRKGEYRGELLLKKFPLDSGKWVEEEKALKRLKKERFFDGDTNVFHFYCIRFGRVYIFRPSLEQSLHGYGGLFWIGNKRDGFYEEGDDFHNSLKMLNVRCLDDYRLDVFLFGYLKDYFDHLTWHTVDLSKIVDQKALPLEEFGKIRWYGYGGIIWENGYSISNRKIFELIVR